MVLAPLFGTSVQALSQFAPTFLRYFHLVMAEPPLPPEVQPRITAWWRAATVGLLGAGGLVDGVPVAVSDQSPSPVALVALTRTLYSPPFSRDVSVFEVPLAVVCRLVESQSLSFSDFHWTL